MHDYDRRKTAAVDKVPLFGKFEARLGEEQLEKMVAKHYKVVPGSLKLKSGIEPDNGGAYINFTYEEEGKPRKGTGSVIVKLEHNGNSIRAYAFVNIDG